MKRLLTLSEAADFLGYQGKWRYQRVLRLLRSIERRTKKQILIDAGGEGNGKRYRVAFGALLRLLPSVSADYVSYKKTMRREIGRLRQEITVNTERIDDVQAALASHLDDVAAGAQ